MTVAVPTITEERCVVRDTGRTRGRSRRVAPGRTSSRHLREDEDRPFGVVTVQPEYAGGSGLDAGRAR